MNTKLKAILCNDDGINAPGIYNLFEALHDHVDITIVAPAEDQSCKGLGISIPRSGYIEAEKVAWANGVESWKVFGTPADCIKFALHYLVKQPPNFIISGINNGSNAGRNIMYSGTVGAVIQGTFCNVPGIAFSCTYDDDVEKFKNAQQYILKIVNHFHKHKMPKGTLINVNFPTYIEGKTVGIKMAKQGKSYWNGRIGSDVKLKGTNKYPILDSWDMHDESEDSDIYLLTQGYITCAPIHVEDLTDHIHHKQHKEEFEKVFL